MNLRIQLAGGAKRSDQCVAAILCEFAGNRLQRRGEVGGHGDLHLPGQHAGAAAQAGKQGQPGAADTAIHRMTP
ncbi:hypothetical protein D3C86_1871680 [compost metagenome]